MVCNYVHVFSRIIPYSLRKKDNYTLKAWIIVSLFHQGNFHDPRIDNIQAVHAFYVYIIKLCYKLLKLKENETN